MPGYEANFVCSLIQRHKCSICFLAMKSPVQTKHGHLFCEECLEPLVKRCHPICPLDQGEIVSVNVFPDNACKREILQLEVFCNFHSIGGCSWIGHLHELESHLKICEYREIQCTQCSQYIHYNLLDQHREKECPMLLELCEYCKTEIPHLHMKDHINHKCPVVECVCPNDCDRTQKMKLIDLEKHVSLKYGTCPLSDMNCPHSPHGCLYVSNRKDMKSHMHQYMLYHAQIQADSFMEFKQQIEKNATSLRHLLEQTNFLEDRIATVEKMQSFIDQKMGSLEEKVERNDKCLVIQDVNRNAEVVKLGHKVEKLQLGIDQFAGNTDSTHTHSRLAELENSVDQSLVSSLDHELRIQLLERATYNGIFLWKVEEFEQRRKKAKEGVTTFLYSNPFYTGRHGYKMCAKLYLNGDGLGKDTHMSFFFVVMRGPIDEFLLWPFEQKVTLSLINQMGKEHVTESFHPDPNSSSFIQPGRREMNVASGCPMFIRLEHLLKGGFLKKDCIYLRVIVDTTNLAKVLPM